MAYDLAQFDAEFQYNDLVDMTAATTQPTSTATPYLYVVPVAPTVDSLSKSLPPTYKMGCRNLARCGMGSCDRAVCFDHHT